MRRIRISLVVITGLIGFYLFISPYIALYHMKKNSDNYDGEALSEYIDFPGLRQSFKDQINKMNVKQTEINLFLPNNRFSGIILERLVDTYVTPRTIMRMMNGENPNPKQAYDRLSGNSPSKPSSNFSFSYESFNKFSITPKSNKDVKYILRRRGIGWKLAEVTLSP